MKKIMFSLMALLLFIATPAFAHVANEKTLYDDIEFSKAKEEIVYLRGLNVIAYEHGAKLFKPNDILTKADLAFWTGTFNGLGGHGAEKEGIQREAVENGLIDSLDGNATYADVNQAFFNGEATVEKPDKELTREAFALYMGKFFEEKVDEKTLFEMAHATPGPTGIIDKVTMTDEGEGEDLSKVYTFTVNEQAYKVSAHPKMLYGPVDLEQWEGKVVADSWIMGHGDEQVLQIVKLEQGQFLAETEKQNTENQTEKNNENVTEDNTKSGQVQSEEEVQTKLNKQGNSMIPIIGGILLVVILAWLFLKKKK